MLKVLWSLDTMCVLHHRPVSLLHFNTRSEINNVCHSERLSSDNCHPMLPSHTAFSKIKALEVVFLFGGGEGWQCICSDVISREAM